MLAPLSVSLRTPRWPLCACALGSVPTHPWSRRKAYLGLALPVTMQPSHTQCPLWGPGALAQPSMDMLSPVRWAHQRAGSPPQV